MLISSEDFVSGKIHQYGSDVAVKILLFAMVFSFVNSLFGFILVVLNKQTKLMMINAGCVIFNLIGNIIVIPSFGFRGASITSVMSEGFIFIFTYWIAQKTLGFHFSPKTLLKVIISAATMGLSLYAGLYALGNISFIGKLVLLIPLGSLVYFLMIIETKAITPEMLKLLKKSQ